MNCPEAHDTNQYEGCISNVVQLLTQQKAELGCLDDARNFMEPQHDGYSGIKKLIERAILCTAQDKENVILIQTFIALCDLHLNPVPPPTPPSKTNWT